MDPNKLIMQKQKKPMTIKAKKQSEKLTEPKLRVAVKARGGMCIKLLAASYVGLPDRLILLPGARVGFVETKSSGDGPSMIQKYIHRKITRLGFKVYVLSDATIISVVLDDIACG